MGKAGPDCSTGLRLLVTGEHRLALCDQCIAAAKGGKAGTTGKSVQPRRLAIFTRQFSVMIDAGLPLATVAIGLDTTLNRLDPATQTFTRYEHDPDAAVTGDADRLKQVIENLLANARVHTPPGTPARLLDAFPHLLHPFRDGPGVDSSINHLLPGLCL